MTAAQFALAASALLTLAGLRGARGKYLELASHFRVQYALAALACLPVFLALGARGWAAACVLYLLAFAAPLLRWYLPAGGGEPAARRTFRLLHLNVNATNTDYARAAALIADESPDVIVLQEATAGWVEALAPLRQSHPHVVARPLENNGSGIALFSRLPLEDARVIDMFDRPSIVAGVRVGGTPVSILTTHPRAPILPGCFESRNEQLAWAARFARRLPEPRVLVGDLNVSPFSPYFGRLEKESGLRDARARFGLFPTWPAWNRLPPLMLPIDHCLVGAGVKVVSLRAGPPVGSDHLPLIVELAFGGAGA